MRAGERLQTLHLAPDEARHKMYANPLEDTKRTQTLWQTSHDQKFIPQNGGAGGNWSGRTA